MVLYIHAGGKRRGEGTNRHSGSEGDDVPQDPGIP